MVLFLSKEYLERNITIFSILHTQFIPDFFVAEYYGLRNTIFWGCGSSVVKSSSWNQAVTQQSQVRSRLPPQSPEGRQESWLCKINEILRKWGVHSWVKNNKKIKKILGVLGSGLSNFAKFKFLLKVCTVTLNLLFNNPYDLMPVSTSVHHMPHVHYDLCIMFTMTSVYTIGPQGGEVLQGAWRLHGLCSLWPLCNVYNDLCVHTRPAKWRGASGSMTTAWPMFTMTFV
jgi:hypothetical protein